MTIECAERLARRLSAGVALAAALTAVPGMVRAAFQHGETSGQPELVFTPLRMALVSVGWFTAMLLAWRPLPGRPGDRTRWVLLVGGFGLYLAGMALAVAGRLALGANYRPSSTVGLALAPGHQLITSGPFAVVRHPMYVGVGAASVGALALYRTWSTVLFIAQLPVLVVRARREEALLLRTFGDAWRSYASRVPAWRPFIRTRW